MASVGEIQTIYEMHKKGITQLAIAKKLSRSPGFVGQYVRAIKLYENGELPQDSKQFSSKIFLEWTDFHESNNKPEKQEPAEQETAEKCDTDALNIRISELSANDKKELAMYAIDQHYFFLKQLTGVI